MPISAEQISKFEMILIGATGTCLPKTTESAISELNALVADGFDFNSPKGRELVAWMLRGLNSQVLKAFLEHNITPEIEKGANYLHIIAKRSKTDSSKATLNLCKSCAKVLIQHGIDPTTKNISSESSYDLAHAELQIIMRTEREDYLRSSAPRAARVMQVPTVSATYCCVNPLS